MKASEQHVARDLRRAWKKECDAARQRVTPALKKDPVWQALTSGRYEPQTRRKELPRLVKKAARLLYPGFSCSVRRGRGTSYEWLYVTLTAKSLADSAVVRRAEVTGVTRTVLESLPLPYATYRPDIGPGGDVPAPCLRVDVRSMPSLQRGPHDFAED